MDDFDWICYSGKIMIGRIGLNSDYILGFYDLIGIVFNIFYIDEKIVFLYS